MTKQEVKEWLVNDGQVPEGCGNNEYWNHWYDVISRMTQEQGQTLPIDSFSCSCVAELFRQLTADERADIVNDDYCDTCLQDEKKHGKCYCSPRYDI